MACSVEMNCLGALTGNAHCTKGVLNSSELVLRSKGSLTAFSFFVSSWRFGLTVTPRHHYIPHHATFVHAHPGAFSLPHSSLMLGFI